MFKRAMSMWKPLSHNNVIRTLILEEYPEQNMKFLEEQNIQFLQFGIAGNKVVSRNANTT